jgi:ATP-dependent DNA ligase
MADDIRKVRSITPGEAGDDRRKGVRERPAARQPNIVPAGRGRKASLLAHRHDSISAGMTLPRIQPIAPTWRKTPFDDPDWLFDLKYDGFRGLCYLDRGRNRLISRNNNVMTRFRGARRSDRVAARCP